MARQDQLIKLHYEEIALDKNQIPLNPDWESYQRMEDVGDLVCFTARDNAELIGYSFFFLKWHIHYSNTRFAHNDVLYVHPNYRKGTSIGKDLIKYSEAELKNYGIDKVIWHIKCDHDWSAIMLRMGYRKDEIIVSKLIGDRLWE